ncbi:hypothetical protein OQ496_10780 [Acetobacter suratthaniensis]|uniref:Uncharacterized protein n=1 Tax=Acetobacter suratthaniensis TaxID=1502841 RepID=A0ABS3LNW2_9PROT|nr:hypothetical protein [Acetobacter suratthaniensis]MBO1329040.1 hypothetical protein [Acetobacter suratthaniensis]MCX2566939.1 hypothetical protein [Acetobacter suratthaniensis]
MHDLVVHFRAPKGSLTTRSLPAEAQTACACCGLAGATLTVNDTPLCLVCAPAYAADDTQIDQHAAIIWLPQLDQGSLSRLVRAAWSALLVCAPGEPAREQALAILDDLSTRREAAAEKIGTYHPSRLRLAVSTLAPHHMLKRKDAASGLRVLPVAAWREQNSEALSTLLTNRNPAP